MKNNPNTQEVREELLSLSGVGPKVADCILLFSDLKRLEEFALNNYGCEFISEAMNFSGKLFKAISENDKKAHIIRSDVDEDSNSLPF